MRFLTWSGPIVLALGLSVTVAQAQDPCDGNTRFLAGAGVDIVGASDHGVSHSLYVRDPDGIELELYADVPDWKEQGEHVATIRPWDPR